MPAWSLNDNPVEDFFTMILGCPKPSVRIGTFDCYPGPPCKSGTMQWRKSATNEKYCMPVGMQPGRSDGFMAGRDDSVPDTPANEATWPTLPGTASPMKPASVTSWPIGWVLAGLVIAGIVVNTARR